MGSLHVKKAERKKSLYVTADIFAFSGLETLTVDFYLFIYFW